MLRLERIAKYRSGVPVLVDVTLDVAPGDCVALAGSPADGMSMILQIAATLRAPDSGSVLIDRFDTRTDLSRARARVAFASGPAACPDGLTVADYIRSARAGRTHMSAPADAGEMLPRIGLRASQYVAYLPAAARERLSIGVACYSGAAVLVLDVGSSLDDPQWREPLLELIRESRDRGAAIMIGLRSAASTSQVATRVARLEAGRLLEEQNASGPSGPAKSIQVAVS